MILKLIFLSSMMYFLAPVALEAQGWLIQIDIESIKYDSGTVTMLVTLPKYKKRLKDSEALSRIRSELITKIINEGIEKTPYNRRFDIDKSINHDLLVKLIGSDIRIDVLQNTKETLVAVSSFDIKHIELKLIDNGYLKKFGL